MEKRTVGVIGATGMVGQRFLTLLDNLGFTDNYIRVVLPPSNASDAYDNEIVKVKITNINHDRSSTTAIIV